MITVTTDAGPCLINPDIIQHVVPERGRPGYVRIILSILADEYPQFISAQASAESVRQAIREDRYGATEYIVLDSLLILVSAITSVRAVGANASIVTDSTGQAFSVPVPFKEVMETLGHYRIPLAIADDGQLASTKAGDSSD